MIDFVFLEYSFDPEIEDPEAIFSRLGKLGFILRSEHISERASFWNQNQCILLVHERHGTGCAAGISGLGFMGLNNKIIDLLGAQTESDSSASVHDSGGAFRTLIIPAEITTNLGGIIKYSMVSKEFETSYRVVDSSKYSYPGLSFISGVVYPGFENSTMEYYTKLGFRYTKETENYIQMLTNSDRFSLLLDKKSRQNKNTLVVCDSEDVFWTTACYTVNQIPMTEFDSNQIGDFGSITHKIVGYNCFAEGTKTSYSISNFIPNALPGVDLIFRTRKQFLGIPEKILEIARA